MPYSSKYDAIQLLDFERMGYNALRKGLDSTPRLVSGSENLYVDPSGTLRKRPAFQKGDLGTIIWPTNDNGITQPDSIDNAAWFKSGLTVSANSGTSPSGTSTADKLVESALTEAHYTEYNSTGVAHASFTDGANSTFSIWAKSTERNIRLQIVNTDAEAYAIAFDLTTDTVVGSSDAIGGSSYTYRSEDNGWKYITLTVANGTGANDFVIRFGPAELFVGSYAGDGSSGVTVWRAQLHIDKNEADRRCERLWLYETIENPAKVYVLGSWKDITGSKYKMYYARIGTSAEWTSVGTTREVDNSVYPHEVGFANGLAYIKGFPDSDATGERLGTVVFDGTDASLKIWGTLGPPTPAQLDGATSSWSATSGSTDVNFGWLYTYSWITETGHISNRAAFKAPTGQGQISASNTGPFSDKIPDIDLAGDADTTGLPTIQVWRSLDGGGVFAALETRTNTGAGTIEYLDDGGAAAAGDPKTDFELDTANLAPSLTSNSPPPAVNYPLVTGTDDIEQSTAIAEYAGRFWYAIGNILHFSGFEEILNGVPHESWPSGLKGNFIRFKNPIRYLIPTSEALYVVTNQNVLWIRGFDRASFRVSPLFEQLGGAEGQNAAFASLRNVACFLTEDNQIALVRGEQLQMISAPLGDEIDNAVSTTTEIQLAGHFFKGSGWLAVGLRDTSDYDNSKIWVYDLGLNQWNPPWDIPFSAITSGRVRESDSERELVVACHEDEGPSVGFLRFPPDGIFSDPNNDQLASGDAAFNATATFNLLPPPGGNHLNLLRVPAAFPNLQKVKIERTKFSSDTDPTIQIRLDDFSTDSFTTLTLEPPDLLAQSTSYVNHWCSVDEACQRAQIQVTSASEAKPFELQTVGLLWHPGAGS